MINKTFRLFISSTFSDFIIERNILNDDIFPEIDKFCQAQGYNFQLIDLRWGVNNEAALSQSTLDICLDEVKRCRTLSPKPNFLLMVGERYGWIPLPAKISRTELERLLMFATDEDKNLITTWYVLDENEIGGEYYLKTRINQFIDDAVWVKEEAAIHQALLKCAKACDDIQTSTMTALTCSATEQEILEGLLSEDNFCDNSIALFRTGYPERDPDQSKIIALKKRIAQKMSKEESTINCIELAFDEKYVEHFKAEIINSLKTNISKEIKRLNEERNKELPLKAKINEIIPKDIMIRREDELSLIKDYISGNDTTPLFIVGDSGSGKTTLLADYIIHSTENIIATFYGLDETSYLLKDCLNAIVRKIKSEYELSSGIDINETNITEGVYKLIHSIPKDSFTIIAIDGLDMFHDIDDIREPIFPMTLPSNVKIIITVASGKIADSFISSKTRTLVIDKFSEKESVNYVSEFLKKNNRQIVPKSQKSIVYNAIKNGSTPLKLKLLSQYCIGWHSADNNELPSSAEETALLHLTNTFNKFGHNKEFVLYALALIASSPYGITEREIQVLMLKFPTVREHFLHEDRYHHNLNQLPFSIWSRLFYDLKGCLSLNKSNGYYVVKFTHNIFNRVFEQNFCGYCKCADSMLIEYYSAQESIIEIGVPNIRKAMILPFLLKKHNYFHQLYTLYNDLEFINSTVLIGRVNDTISDICHIVEFNNGKFSLDRLKALYNCLQENRIMLNCYYDGFEICASYAGILQNTNLPIEKEYSDCKSNDYLFFPYSFNSKIEWNFECNKYAVYYNSYIYICDSKTSSELCRIYIEPNQSKEKAYINKVIWISDVTIAAMSAGDGIYVFNISDKIPNCVGKIDVDTAPESVEYTKNYRILIVYLKKLHAIAAYNIDNCQQIYNFRYKSTLGFDLHESELYIKERANKIDVYNVVNGNFIKSIHVKYKVNFFEAVGSFINKYYIHKVNENIWIEKSEYNSTVAIYNLSKHTKDYIHSPFYQIDEFPFVGRKILLVVRTNFIISIDLENDLVMKYYKISNIKSVSWIVKDYSISILTDVKLVIVDLSCFSSFPDELSNCIIFHKSIFDSFACNLKSINKSLAKVLPLLKINIYDYDVLFSEIFNKLAAGRIETTGYLYKEGVDVGSIVAYSSEGTKAISFESKNTIIVYDTDNSPIVYISGLKLGINNNILKLCFSENSQLLFLWCNNYIKIYDVLNGKVTLSINLMRRPALCAWLNSESEAVHVILCNQREYLISLKNSQSDLKKLPKSLIDKIDLDNNSQFFGPYVVWPDENELYVQPLMDLSKFSDDITKNVDKVLLTPYKWFNKSKAYYAQSTILIFRDGEFYLKNGGEERQFKHQFADFNKSQLLEQLHDSSPFLSYIREKNDLLSKLYEIKNRYLVLISRLLNSIIIFDKIEMKVTNAIKVNGNIIGCNVVENTQIEIATDVEPYFIQFILNL